MSKERGHNDVVVAMGKGIVRKMKVMGMEMKTVFYALWGYGEMCKTTGEICSIN